MYKTQTQQKSSDLVLYIYKYEFNLIWMYYLN